MISFKKEESNGNEVVSTIIQKIRRGDSKCRQKFIDENKTLIMRAVSSALNKSNVVKNSSEFILGVEVFNYCLNNFDLESKISFYEYAEKSIIMRINEYNMRGSDENFTEITEDSEKISQFKKELWEFGLTTKDIIKYTPKQQDDLRRAVLLARKITESNELYNNLQKDKHIPMSAIDADLQDKTILTKNAKYIIAVCLLMKSNMENVKGYLKNAEMNWTLDNHRGIILELTGNGSVIINDEGKFLFFMKQYNIKLGDEVNYEDYLVKLDNGIIEKRYFKVLMGVTVLLLIAMISLTFIYRIIDESSTNNTELQANKNNSLSKHRDKKNPQNDIGKNVIEDQASEIPSSNKNDDNKTNSNENDDTKDAKGTKNAKGKVTKDNKNKDSDNANEKYPSNDKKSNRNENVDKGVSAKLDARSINQSENDKSKSNVKDDNKKRSKDKITKQTNNVKASATKNKGANNKSTPSKGGINTKKNNTPVRIDPTPIKESNNENVGKTTDYFPTLRATGLPSEIQIASDKYEVTVGDEYIIVMNIRHGNNGTSWILYENGIQTASIHMADRSPEAQRVQRLFVAHKEGIYTYRCDVNNTFGTVSSESIQVLVKK